MKPNIFAHATRELSQDAFFAWLLEWADNRNREFDQELNNVAKDFVRLLLNKTEDYVIDKVEVRKQWQNIDISVEVNDEYFIVIEDKTNTREHSGQLKRYEDIANAYCESKNLEPILRYLKTGNESRLNLLEVEKQKFIPLDRSSILRTLANRKHENSIFADFVDYLRILENNTNSIETIKSITTDWKAAEGFYMSLENKISGAGWGNVPNQSGGFLGLWYYSIQSNYCNIYIQIENTVNKNLSIEDRIKVVLKISEWDKSLDKLYSTFEELKIIGNTKGIYLVKPKKFRIGSTSTLAVLENAFSANEDDSFDIDDFVSILKQLEKTLDAFLSNHLKDQINN